MKKLFCFLLLLLNFIGFSQQRVSLVLGKTNHYFSNNSLSFSPVDISINLNLSNLKSYADKYWLEVYYPTTQMNDHYVTVGNNYYLTNTKSFPMFNFDGTRIDSFNPNGACDLGSGIVSGLINLLFEKF
jgi:hypothetical protein